MPKRLSRALLFILVLLIPSQLGKHLWPTWAYVYGLPVDYLSPAFYSTDIIILILCLIFRKKIRLPLWLIIFSVANILFSSSPINSVIAWIRLFEFMVLFKVCLTVHLTYLNIQTPMRMAAIWVSILSWWQLVIQKSVGGIWYLLGERTFSLNTPHIATTTLFNNHELFLRPYSTFPHPNSLAGYLLVSYWLIQKRSPLLSFLLNLTILSTASRVAITIQILLLIIEQVSQSQKRFSIQSVAASFITSQPTISERITLLSNAGIQILHSPLLGVGLGNFIPSQTLNNNFISQPVHNIYILLATEIGLPMTVLIILLLIKTIKNLHQKPLKYAAIAILLSGMFDHYWLTLHQNQLLFALIISLIIVQSKLDAIRKNNRKL